MLYTCAKMASSGENLDGQLQQIKERYEIAAELEVDFLSMSPLRRFGKILNWVQGEAYAASRGEST